MFTKKAPAALIFFFLFAAQAQAQEGALVESIDRLAGRIFATQSLFDSADVYERPLLEARLEELRTQRYAEVLVFARRALDGDDAMWRQARQLLQGQSRALRARIDQLNLMRVSLLARRGAVNADEQWRIDQESRLLWGRYLDSLRLLIETVKMRDQLGMESISGRAYVEGQLRRQAALTDGRITQALARQAQLAAAPQPQSEEAKTRHTTLEHELNTQLLDAATALSQVADLFGLLGLEAEETEYRTLAISVDGRLSTGGSVGQVVAGWQQYLLARAPGWFFNGALVVIILGVFWGLARGVGTVLDHWLTRMQLRMSSLAQDFLVGIAVKLVIFAGILIAASQLGIEIGPLLAGLGIAGFIVGFALQDSLSNFASGLMILICRPFDEGDFIDTAGVQGTVHRMNLMQTTIFTVENHRLTIPNNVIWGGIIRNITSQKLRRIDLVFGVGYEADVEQVERVLTEVITAHPKVVDDPALVVKLNTLADSAVEFIARPWVASADYLEVFWDLQKQVKLRFDKEGISIPYPQRELTIRHETPPAKPAKPAKPAGKVKSGK